MADDTLCIGDYVCLYSAESYGFVFATQSSSVNNEVAVGAKQDRLKPDMKDQNLLTFKICVANRYKLNKKYRKLKKKSDEDPDNPSLRSRLHQAQVAAKSEADDNELKQKRKQGKKVLYGQIIQLNHRFTLKYIHVSTTTTSHTESSNMAVELHEYDAKHAQFKVIPRYKVKAEGDVVQVDDQIMFESVKSAGEYLHVSKTLLGGISVYHKSFELNLSVQQSGFTVYRKYKPSPDDEKKVKVGDLIRFYHKEMEAYMVAEGLFDDELTEDVHLRMRPLDQSNPKTLFPSSSAITYWQIELKEGIVAGGVLKWGQQCRLLHMCTRKYLTVEANGRVTLTTNHLDPGTVFRLHPVIWESDDIPEDSYCRIEHVVSGHWLHAFTDDYQKKQAEMETEISPSMVSLKWSTAQLKKLGTIVKKQYDDAFTIQSVQENLQELFNFMAGMVPFIQKLLSDKKNGILLNAKMANNVMTSLKEITEFMIVDGEPIKKRQKLVRNLRIVELLVGILKSPLHGADQYYMTRIFVHAYYVLYTYLMGDSRNNQLYIAKYIDFFRDQFKIKEGNIGLNAAQLVIELIRDNRKIVDRITHDHIDGFVNMLREKNYRYLDLLSVLCVCDGVSIVDNQKYITHKWLNSGHRDGFCTDFGENIGRADGIMFLSTNNGTSWSDLETFANKGQDNDEYLYFEHQLYLFGNLCSGQNSHSISAIIQKLTWKEALTCLSSDGLLPDQLRAMYCDLIITMFVDRSDNHSVVDRVKLSYIPDQVDNEENMTNNSGSLTYKYFGELSQWISDFLGRNSAMVASQIGHNMLVKQVLRLVHYLVLFGFYDKSNDIKKLLRPLMNLLDGTNDKPSPNCDDEMLQVFRTSQRFELSPESKAIVEAKIQALEVLDLFFNFILNIRLEKFINLFKSTNQAEEANQQGGTDLSPLMDKEFDLVKNQRTAKAGKRKLNEIFDATSFPREFKIVDILLDLSHYDYDDMVRKSMHLLNQYFSAHHSLFVRAVQAQVLITDMSKKVYLRIEELLPTMKRLASNKLDDHKASQLADILDELIGFCHLEDEDEEPHFMNQNILYNNGIIEDVFTILAHEIDVKLLEQYTGLRRVFQKTFILLKILARDNKIVQHRLFDRLDLLLSKQGAASELADALTEVFTGNKDTCMKIAQNQVQKIMGLVTEHKSAVPQFIDLLNAVVKGEERNQSFVMTYFRQFRADVAIVIDQSEAARESVLMTGSSHDLNYLLAIVDLLATCAEAGNRCIESIWQKIKIPELFKVLNNPNINDNLKQPFLRFFLWVYLNTTSGMIESGAGDIPHDPAMWGYLTSLSGTLAMVTEFSRNNSSAVKRMLQKPPGKSERGVDRTDVVCGSIHYLFDVVMPFLQVFCWSYYKLDRVKYPEELKNMNYLTKKFKRFLKVIAPLVSIERQMSNLLSCMRVLFSSSTLHQTQMEEFQSMYGEGIQGQDVRSEGRTAYNEYYEGEEKLNRKLNVFAVNMKTAFGGVNNVQTQIGYASKNPYSEEGGGEELPLGPEFQAHINSFINPAGTNGLEKYRMAQKLIKALAISTTLTNLNEKEKIEKVDLDMKCMQLLRGMLHNEIGKLPDDFGNDVKGCKKRLKLIAECQNALAHYNAINGTLEHLSRPQDSIVRELLAFLACLLFNGNKKVQVGYWFFPVTHISVLAADNQSINMESMYTYFTGKREEVFFFSIKSRITLSSTAARERRVRQAMHQANADTNSAQARQMARTAPVDAWFAHSVNRDDSTRSKYSRRRSGRQRPGVTPIVRPGRNTLGVPSDATLTDGIELMAMNGRMISFGSNISRPSGARPGNNQVGPVPTIEMERERPRRVVMENNVVSFVFVDEQLQPKELSLLFDSDINAFRGSISIANFKFPLLANLTRLQRWGSRVDAAKYEFMFSCNERDFMRVFLYREGQRMYSERHKCLRPNQRSMYEILNENNCDEAMVYFDVNNFDYTFQTDNCRSDFGFTNSILTFLTSLPAKILYGLILSYKAATVYGWLVSLV